MSKRFMDKVFNFIGFEEVEEDSPKAPEMSPVKELKNSGRNQIRTELTAVPTNRHSKIISTQPKNFNDVQVVAEHLKNGQPVIVNLSEVQPEEAQRILDYASGVSFAINGSAKKVNSDIFLFVPSGVDIVGAGDISTFTQNVEPVSEKVNTRWFQSESA